MLLAKTQIITGLKQVFHILPNSSHTNILFGAIQSEQLKNIAKTTRSKQTYRQTQTKTISTHWKNTPPLLKPESNVFTRAHH
jgi:hypothetical protein